MSTESSGKREGGYVMPEEFSFGLEERKETEPDISPDDIASVKPDEERSAPVCKHKWEALPEAQQTLEGEGKTIWRCLNCGNKTNTYSWDKP